MKRIFFHLATFSALLLCGRLAADENFELSKPGQAEKMKSVCKAADAVFLQDFKGRPALRFDKGGSFNLPKDFNGSVSFYDPIFKLTTIGTGDMRRGGFFHNLSVSGSRSKDKGQEYFMLTLSDDKNMYWGCSVSKTFFKEGNRADERRQFETSIYRRDGWTAISFVVEGQGSERSLAVYVDGRCELKEVVGDVKFDKIGFSDDVCVDGLSVCDNASSFKPAAVEGVVSGDEAKRIFLKPGDRFALKLKLDPKAASCWIQGKTNKAFRRWTTSVGSGSIRFSARSCRRSVCVGSSLNSTFKASPTELGPSSS